MVVENTKNRVNLISYKNKRLQDHDLQALIAGK
jgi:hypothetical protein